MLWYSAKVSITTLSGYESKFFRQLLQQQQTTTMAARITIQVQLSSKIWQRQLLLIMYVSSVNLQKMRSLTAHFYTMRTFAIRLLKSGYSGSHAPRDSIYKKKHPAFTECLVLFYHLVKSKPTAPSFITSLAPKGFPPFEMKPSSQIVLPSANILLTSMIGISR